MKYLLTLLTVLFLLVSTGFTQDYYYEANLTWTATGDDGSTGTASFYDLRYSTDSMTLINDWDNAIQLHGEPDPSPPGTVQEWSQSIEVYSDSTYYFALKVGDEVPNWSSISNIHIITIEDTIPPGAVIDLKIEIRIIFR